MSEKRGAATRKNTSHQRCRKCGTSTGLKTDLSNSSGFASICRKCHGKYSVELRQRSRQKHGAKPTQQANSPRKSAVHETELDHQLRSLLASRRPHPWTVEELSDQFDVGVGRIREAIERMADGRVNVQQGETGGFWISSDIQQRPATVIPLESVKGQRHLFGLTADNHLCSKYARMDVLEALFDIWADQGVKTVYQCGNMIDGEARFNKGDIVAFGLEAQVDFFVEHWPRRKGIVTKFVTGDDHEGWYVQREHVDIGQIIEDRARRAGRTDLVYLGHMEHDIVLQAPAGKAVVRLIHAGGGSSYATSYAAQKIVESYQGGQKPQVLLVGHYHKAEYGYPREVHVVQAAATQDQTPFLRKNKIQSHLGGWTISFEQSDDGLIHGFTPRFDPFYDRDFYEDKQWKYRWRAEAA